LGVGDRESGAARRRQPPFTGRQPAFAELAAATGRNTITLPFEVNMRSNNWMATAALVLMLSTALLAGGLIWMTAVDPMTVATVAATGDVPTLLAVVATRMIALVW
jgi:hypothetical protein